MLLCKGNCLVTQPDCASLHTKLVSCIKVPLDWIRRACVPDCSPAPAARCLSCSFETLLSLSSRDHAALPLRCLCPSCMV